MLIVIYATSTESKRFPPSLDDVKKYMFNTVDEWEMHREVLI